MEVGELYRFEGTISMRLYGKTFIYLGEDFIHRTDGVTVENHKVLFTGSTAPSIIDRNLLKWAHRLDLERK